MRRARENPSAQLWPGRLSGRDFQGGNPLPAVIPQCVVRYITLMPENLPANGATVLHLYAIHIKIRVLAGKMLLTINSAEK
jgi:hypothetical protein